MNKMEMDATPRTHGQWIEVVFWKSRDTNKPVRHYTNRCSVCSADVGRKHRYKYCPHCGSIMDIKEGF